MEPFVPCTLRRLPVHLHSQAVKDALAHNPVNRPAGVLAPQHLALLTTRYWGPRGVRLTVGFLDGAPPDLQRCILQHMNAWGHYCNVGFALTSTDPQVRITRTPGDGYWSYLGTDVLSIPADQPTMNLDSFTMRTPESEYRRVVRHETGHTLGFPHEHARREIVQRIDRQRAYDYFGRTQGWSPEDVNAQVLTPLEEGSLFGTVEADPDSIMCYQLPAAIMADGVPVAGGLDIEPTDAAFAAQVYPLALLAGAA